MQVSKRKKLVDYGGKSDWLKRESKMVSVVVAQRLTRSEFSL
jgi:hypothetical protein